MVNGANLPTREELIAASKQRKLSQLEILVLKSRSFAIPIHLLGKSKGDREANKKEEVQNLYIDLRELDTIEDCTLKSKDKIELMDGLLYIFNEVVRRKEDDSIDDLLKEKLGDITKRLKKGLSYKGKLDEEEEAFVLQFGHGESLKTLQRFEPEMKEIIGNCMNGMSIGMKEFMRRGGIDTAYDIERYCDYVAGSVGEALTKTVNLKDRRQLNVDSSRKFSEYLQMTNITKNIREDYEKREISYIPKEMRPDMDNESLMKRTDKAAKDTRAATLDKMLHMAERNFQNSVNYISSVPEELSGYAAFCLVPLLTARETLKTMKESGAEAVFNGEENAIKISRETFSNIYIFSERIVEVAEGLRRKSWEMDYRDSPAKFSFEPGEYEKWAYNTLK